MRGIESLAGDLCMVWVIGWLRSTLRIRDIVSLRTCSWVLRVSCDTRCYRRQRFKPFGLISMRLVGYTIPQVAEVQPFGLLDSVSCVQDTTGGRGSNLLVWLVRAWGFSFPQVAEVQTLWLVRWGLFGYCFSGSAQVQTLWVYDQFGSLSA